MMQVISRSRCSPDIRKFIFYRQCFLIKFLESNFFTKSSCIKLWRGKHSTPVVLPQAAVEVCVHDHVIQDDFSWLQDFKCAKVKKVLKNENRFTSQVMSDSELFQRDLVGKFEDIANRTGYYQEDNLPVSFGDFLYYTRRSRDHGNFLVHCRRRQNDSKEEILFDEASTVGYWDYFEVKTMKVSPSQKFVAFIVETSGSDTYCGILIDTVRKPGHISEQIPCVNLEWSGFDNVLYYTTFNNLHRANKVWRHEIGQDSCQDELIFEEGDSRCFVDVSCTKDRRFVTINSSSKTTSEVYVLDCADARASVQLVRAREPGIEYYVEHCRDLFYILTNYPNSGNYQVVVANEKDTCSHTEWKSITSNSNKLILDDMDIFSNYCILYEKKDLSPRLTVLPLLGPKNRYTIQFHDDVTSLTPGCNVNFDSSVVQFTIASPINLPVLMELDFESGKMRNLSKNVEEQGRIAGAALYRSKLTALSKDGTKVPITIFHKTNIELSGQHPVLVHVYGSYGINVNMDFSPEKLQLLKEGWVLAFCHVRGGGELGSQWYHLGRRKNKNKTFEDFEACVKAIHEQKYSSPHLTAVIGASAGGLPVAVLCNNAPHLVKAAVLKVPFVDLMTSMLDEGLALTAQEYEEFGNPRLDLQDFNNLKSFCPYMNISKQHYPSMLFMSSVNDVRVPYWMSLKFVSKLRHLNSIKEYSNQQGMVLLKTDFESGHFGTGTFEEAAFMYAFLYKALGLPMR